MKTERQQSDKSRSKKDTFKAWLVEGAAFAGTYELPVLSPCHAKPERAIPFDKALRATEKNAWVHFFTDDRKFECIWNNPKAYINRLKQFEGVISPDFSLYRDMPLSMQIWSTYRNRALAYWLQREGVKVIPNVQWGDERSYAFCFDGIPAGGTVSVSTNGCIRGKEDRRYFKQGLAELMKRLHPQRIVNYSYMPEDIFSPCRAAGIEIIHLPNFHDVVRKRKLS